VIGKHEAYVLVTETINPSSAVTDRITALYNAIEANGKLQKHYARIRTAAATPIVVDHFPDRRPSRLIPGLPAPLRDGVAAMWLSCEDALRSAQDRRAIDAILADEARLGAALANVAKDLEPSFVQGVMERSARLAFGNAEAAARLDQALDRISNEMIILVSRSVGVAELQGGQDDPGGGNYNPDYGGDFTICEFSSSSDFWTIFWCVVLIVILILILIAVIAAS
jgi:hypothetical protein